MDQVTKECLLLWLVHFLGVPLRTVRRPGPWAFERLDDVANPCGCGQVAAVDNSLVMD